MVNLDIFFEEFFQKSSLPKTRIFIVDGLSNLVDVEVPPKFWKNHNALGVAVATAMNLRSYDSSKIALPEWVVPIRVWEGRRAANSLNVPGYRFPAELVVVRRHDRLGSGSALDGIRKIASDWVIVVLEGQ